MNSIKINIVLPKASELKSDLKTLLSQIEKDNTIKIKLDNNNFLNSLKDISQAITSLKAQISSVAGLEGIIKSTSINSTTNAIQQQTRAIQENINILKKSSSDTLFANGDVVSKELVKIKDQYGNLIETVNRYKNNELTSTTGTITSDFEKRIKLEKEYNDFWQKALKNREIKTEELRNKLNSKLNESKGNKNFTLVDDSVFTNLQQRINSITTNTSEKEIKELQQAINNLGSSDNQIVRLQNAIVKHEGTIKSLKDKYKDLIPKDELNKSIDSINKLKEALGTLQSGGSISKDSLNNILNSGTNNMRVLASATKTASDNQRLYNKEVVTFNGALKDVFAKVGVYNLAYTAINKVKTEIRDGIKTIVDMDTALANMNKVVDLSKRQLLEMRGSAVELGRSMGRSSIDVANAMAEFGRMYKDTDDIKKLASSAILGANVMDNTSADTVAKGLTTIISSMKLEAKDATMIIDSLNEVQNNYRISASNMLDGLSEVASVANTAGVSLQELEGYLTAVSVATGESGSEIGNALKSIVSRVYKVGAEGLEANGKPALALKEIGVSVRDVENNFRPLNDILVDLNIRWKTLTDTEKIYIAQQVGGVHRFNSMMALMNNFDMALESTSTAMNSMGSATKENEIYLNSIEGRLKSLKAQSEGFWLEFMSSDAIKGTVSIISELVSGLSVLQSSFGSLGTTVGLLSTAFLMFAKTPLRTFSVNVIESEKVLVGFKNETGRVIEHLLNLGGSSKEVSRSMSASQKATTLLKGGYKALGGAALATKVQIIALQTVLSLGLSMALTTIIGVVSSFVKSLGDADERAADLAKTTKELSETLEKSKGFELDIKKYETIKEQLRSVNLSEEQRKGLHGELETVKQRLISLDDEAYAILNNENLALEVQLDLLRQINEKKSREKAEELDDKLGNGFWHLDESKNAEKAKRDMDIYISQYKEIINLQKTAKGGVIQTSFGSLDSYAQEETLEKLKTKINDSNLVIQKYNGSVNEIKKSNIETSRTTVDLNDNQSQFVVEINKSTEAIDRNTQAKKSNNVNSTANNVEAKHSRDINELENAYISLGYSIKDVKKEMEEMKELSETQQDTKLISDSTEVYNNSKIKVQELKETLEDLNKEQVISSELIKKIANSHPDIMKLGSAIYDLGSVQEFLNNQIQNQVDIQNTAYQNMIMNDNNYYNEKIKNNQDFMALMNESVNAFNAMNGTSYQIDLNQYSNLNELKAGVLNQFGNLTGSSIDEMMNMYAAAYSFDSQNYADLNSMKQGYTNQLIPTIVNWITSFTNGNADGYTSDLKEFNDLAQMKAYTISQLSAKMAELQSQWSSAIADYNNVVSQVHRNNSIVTTNDMYNALKSDASNSFNRITSLNSQMKQITSGINLTNKVFDGLQITLSGYESGFNGSNFNAGSVGSGSGSGKGSSSKKEIADIQLKKDRYYELNDVIQDYNNLLSQNKELQNYANEYDKNKLIMEEVALMRKKKELLSELINEQKKEKQELANTLRSYNFQIDSMDNLTNSQSRLQQLQSWANSQDNSSKEKSIELVKKLEEATKRYTDLCNSEIPKTTQEWQQMNSAIKSSAENMLTDIRDRLVSALRKKREEEKSAKEKVLDERIKNLQEQIKALDNEENDKNKKLIKLSRELDLWKQDNSPFAKKKIQELEELIAQLEKEIKKEELQQQIDLAEKTKEELQKTYEEQLSDKTLYGEADKLLTQKNMDEIVSLIQSYDETFKSLGNLLGENFAKTIKIQVENAIKSLDILKGEISSLSKPSSGGSSNSISGGGSFNSSSSSSTSSKPITTGSRVRVNNLSAPIYYTSTSGSNSGTWGGTGIVNSSTPLYIVNESNGRVALSKNTSVSSTIGWIDRNNIAGFRIGGSVGNWLSDDGKIIQVHSGEGVLTAEQNKAWLNLVDVLPKISDTFGRLFGGFSLANASGQQGDISVTNNFDVVNNTPFETERFGQNVDKLFKEQLRKFGRLK